MSRPNVGRVERLLSLDETNQIFPDHDYPSTSDNLWHYGADEDVQCFTILNVPVTDVDPGQLLDDPEAHESQAKVESIRSTIRSGETLPPVYLRHTPADDRPYYLFEGMHRFTASYREGVRLLAWVAHLGCCEQSAVDSEADEGQTRE